MTESENRGYHADALERKLLETWRREDTFRRSIENRRGKPAYVFLEGPPTANGLPHAGHVLTRTLKDSVCRYKTMRGYLVERKAGWDCHGLPVEIEVEKELGLKNKQDIERYGVAKFNQKCRESVFRYKKDWEEMSERVGFWLDVEHPYVTLENDYIESVWWSLQEAWKKKLLYKGFRVAAYCPRCGTGLSSHEVGLGYKSVEEPSVFVKVPVAGAKDEFILAWTTTPWTLPGNVGLAVGPDITYVKVEQAAPRGTERYILAKDLVSILRGEYKVLGEFPGRELVGTKYEPLFSFMRDTLYAKAPTSPEHKAFVADGVNQGWVLGRKEAREHPEKQWTVLAADFVTTTDGTGVVHTAVMYGEEDYELGMREGLTAIHTVNTEGRFKPFVTKFANQFVKDADPHIIEDLRERNLLYRVKNHTHDYPFCWRCSTPLLYYARDQWFVRMNQLRERLVELNASVNWVPAHVKDGRFGDFIRNVRDWALSRNRYWGTPLPIWTCTKCSHTECIGSIADLAKLGGEPVRSLVHAGKLDLHKPAVDEIHLACPKCQSRMDRDPNVIDTWYDSGSAHFAQWHYPFENAEVARKATPVDFIAEGIDQTRGWFYTLLATATVLFDQPAYRNVVVNGLVLDEKGQKMSKSKRNYTDPNEVFKKFGADSMRWYLLSSSAPTADKRFFEAAIQETHTKFFLTLWNSFQFLQTYAALDGWKPGAPAPAAEKRPHLDRWLLARLETVAHAATREADLFNLHKATTAIQDFLVDDLSNWWLRRSRRRFWSEDGTEDKASAYATLQTALATIAKLAAPFAPFATDHLYRQLRTSSEPASVHHCDYPQGSPTPQPVEATMADVREITEAARRLRDQAQVKTRIPLPRLTVVRGPASPLFRDLLELVREEANVKEVVVASTGEGLEDYEAKVNQQAVGREFKNDAKPILEAARAADPRALGRELATQGHVRLAGQDLDAKFFNMATVAKAGTLKADLPRGGTILLDARLTPELEAEGWARELVRRIQEMRKEARLQLEDTIDTRIEASEAVAGAAQRWADLIAKETRSRRVRFGAGNGQTWVKDWDIEGERVTIAITKADR